jgi:signal peptidase I
MIFETQRGQAIPTLTQVAAEKRKLDRRARRRHGLVTFLVSFAITILSGAMILLMFLPVLEVSGSSMEPTLQDGDILVLMKTREVQTGEMCGMYAKGRLILKRVIGLPGDVVRMDEDGNVYVNDVELKEPYVSQKTLGNCDLSFPYTVPENSLFVLGDHRETSIDSRSDLIGCVDVSEVMGQVVARIWPPQSIGWVG